MHKEKIKTFLKNHIIILAFICFIILFSILFLYKNWNICESIFDTIQICYKEKISNKILRFWNISFLKNTEINDYSGNALSIICGIIVGIPAFLLPLFFSVFDSKITNLTTNQEFHFQKMIEKNNIKGFYTLIFIFIIYLFLQNYFTFLNWGNLTYFINIIFTIGFIDKTYNILNNVIFRKTNELIIKNYDSLLNNNNNNNNFLKNNFFYYLIKDMIFLVKNNKIEQFQYIKENYFEKNKQNIRDKIDIEYFITNDGFETGLSFLKEETIKQIEKNKSFFKNILYFSLTCEYLSFETYYFYCFKSLNDIIWKKNINSSESDYIISNSLENKYYKDLFKEFCKDIYEAIESFSYKIKHNTKYSLENLIKNNFEYVQEPLLYNCIWCICESLRTGNADAIDYFLDLLFHFINIFSLEKYEDMYNPNDIRKNFFTYCNSSNESLLVKNFLKINKYGYNREDIPYPNKSIMELNTDISDSLLKNFVLDISYILFNKLSEKYNNYIENNNDDKNIFIFKIIKKIIKYKPILDVNTDRGDLNYTFFDFNSIFYSIIRKIICAIKEPFLINSGYSKYSDVISSFFEEKYSGIGKIQLIENLNYIGDFEIILLLLAHNFLPYNENDFNNFIENLLLSENFDDYKNIQYLEQLLNQLNTKIESIKYENYKNYINSVFNNEVEYTLFNENKTKVNEFLKKIIESLENKKIQEIQGKFSNSNTTIKTFENIKKTIIGNFKTKIKSMRIYEKFNMNKENFKDEKDNESKDENDKNEKYQILFNINNINKEFFIDESGFPDTTETFCNTFYEYFDSKIFLNLINSIRDIEKENISSKYFVDTYLEKENKNYVTITSSEGTENNIIFKTLKGIGAESYIEKSKLYFENWINLKWYFKSVDFLPEDTVIIIPKDYISKIELDLKSLNIDYREMKNNFITLLFSCFYDVEFNKDKKKDIKIFNIIYEDKND